MAAASFRKATKQSAALESDADQELAICLRSARAWANTIARDLDAILEEIVT